MRRVGLGLIASLSLITGIGCTVLESRLGGNRHVHDHADSVPLMEFQIALEAEQTGDLAKAQHLYGTLQREHPRESKYAHRMAVVSYLKGDRQTAKRYFERALELAPDDPELLSDIGFASIESRDYDTAETMLRKSIQLEPNAPQTVHNLAFVLGIQGRHVECLTELRKTHDENQAQLMLAEFHIDRGEQARAVACYRKVIASDPQNTIALSGLARWDRRQLDTVTLAHLTRSSEHVCPVVAPVPNVTHSVTTIAGSGLADAPFNVPVAMEFEQPTIHSLSGKWSDPAEAGQIHRDFAAAGESQTPFRIDSHTHSGLATEDIGFALVRKPRQNFVSPAQIGHSSPVAAPAVPTEAIDSSMEPKLLQTQEFVTSEIVNDSIGMDIEPSREEAVRNRSFNSPNSEFVSYQKTRTSHDRPKRIDETETTHVIHIQPNDVSMVNKGEMRIVFGPEQSRTASNAQPKQSFDELADAFRDDDNQPETPLVGAEEFANISWVPMIRTRQHQVSLVSAETSSRHSSHDFLKGYCPVALRDLEELIPALDLFSMVHEGVEYHFSTSVALAKFRKNPDRYAPMARGADLVVAHVTGETVSGSLDFSVWHRDHLYLFSNARNLESFREAPFLFTSE